MKQLILLTSVLLMGWNSYAQFSIPPECVPQITSLDTGQDDTKAALKSMGVDIYRFKMPIDSLRPHEILFQFDEYLGDSLVKAERVHMGRSYMYFTEEQGGPGSFFHDELRIITNLSDKNKPTMRVGTVDGSSMGYGFDSQTDMPYGVRPFASSPFEEKKKIPLVMVGSYWKDERGVIRFCGNRELSPDDEMLTHSPHYLVVSVELQPVE